MRVRQFGKGKIPYASEHNLAQDYVELNEQEAAIDAKIIGIVDKGTLRADPTPHTIVLEEVTARTSYGQRIYVPTSVGIYVEPVTSVTSGHELWVTVYAYYTYSYSEADTDTDSIPYYKDYQDDFIIDTVEGELASTGLAVKPTISSTGVILCDILYDYTLYTTGALSDSDINVDRQDRRVHTHSNLDQLDLITDGAHETRTNNPHSTTAAQVGLGNVTNDAQVKKIASSTVGNIPTWDGTTGDLLNNGYAVEETFVGSTGAIPTAFASKEYIDNLTELENVWVYKGEYNLFVETELPAANAGHVYKIVGSGLLGESSTGIGLIDNDYIICLSDLTPAGSYSTVGQYWGFIQGKSYLFVTGPPSSTPVRIVVFNGSTGLVVTESSFYAQDATTSQVGFVQLSNTYLGASSAYAITEHALSDGLATLSNVTNDAQLKRAAGDFNSFTEDTTPTALSITLLNDADDGFAIKYIKLDNIPLNLVDAIHLTSSGELYSLTGKSPVDSSDVLLIEDSDDSFSKKKVIISNLSALMPTTTSNISLTSTGTDVNELNIESTGFTTVDITSNLNLLSSYTTQVNTWATSGNLNTARYLLAGSGVQNSALSFGGTTDGSDRLDDTEIFNGSTWAVSGNLAVGDNRLAGCGITNSSLGFGGSDGINNATTQKFNGSTWSTDAGWDLNTGRYVTAGSGTQNAALSFGGLYIASQSAVTEKFNGTSWSTDAGWNLNTARSTLTGKGVLNASVSFGGSTGTNSAVTEKFNGSVWVTSGNLNTARRSLGGAGTQNSALSFGGYVSSASAISEKFNGSTWVATGSLNTAQYNFSGSGVQNAALSFGGNGPSNVTEKFNEPFKLKLFVTALENITDNTSTGKFELETYDSSIQFSITCPATISYGIVCEREYDTYANRIVGEKAGTNILNYGYWITSGNLNTARWSLGGAGSQNSALSFGGYILSTVQILTEKFDGSSWSTSASWNLNTARLFLEGSGSQNAALSFGGTTTGSDYLSTTEKFNGSVWTTTGNLNTARSGLFGFGTQNSSLACGGSISTSYQTDLTEKFNGSAWSNSGNLNTGRADAAGCGLQSSGVIFGGAIEGIVTNITEKFNGYTWVTSNSLIDSLSGLTASGKQSSALCICGSGDEQTSSTETFNGNYWISSAITSVARSALKSSGSQFQSLAFGGTDGSNPFNLTEKFNYNRDISELYSEVDCYVDKSNVTIEY